MKKYMKNKNFIPEKFYEKKQVKKNRRETEILLVILIVNLFLLPITVKSNEQAKKATSINKINVEEKQLGMDEFENINIWIENIINDDVEEAYIDKNKGEIIINSIDNIDKLSSKKSLTINDVNLIDDGQYKLGVSLNE
ncbi:hypothetical protein [Clostridium sp. C2-6-12]|uniref:hypothetical protein n=1 Tax=Clostridium sp. C2-6-12 TaxID=2698832 RepID=UPI00136E8E54|nr:hypothetical protein [Clostridium sp. C2-6-12]